MQIVNLTNRSIGSFDWELPPDLAATLSRLIENDQNEVRDFIRGHVETSLLTLVAALMLGKESKEALKLIGKSQKALLKKLQKMQEQ